MFFKRIALIIAVEDEAKPIIEGLGLSHKGKLLSPLPMEFYEGRHNSLNIDLVTSGKCDRFNVDNVGPQAAILNTATTIGRLQPDLIINPGTAGGFVSVGASIGDVYLSYPMICYHDRRIPIPGFDAYGIGSYYCFDTRGIAEEFGLKTGIISTGSSLDYTDKDLELIKSYGGVVKEMEAASIAWVADLYKIPFFAVKSITDLVDNFTPTEEEYLRNLTSASMALSREVVRIIKYFAQ
ncbi:MAG: 5'-methylthioadenosine nucleosidase [Bacteroidales bacterium]|nr:5'-methylthioadenosine nucleosidase [Bacteroidales bacterium]